MFPFDIEEDEIKEVEDIDKEPCEYGIDFETGQLTGKKVYGLEALKVWIYFALGCDRYHYEHHTWNYGHDLETLIGEVNDEDYVSEKAKRIVEDCLTVNEHIQGIKNWECICDADSFEGKFNVDTDLGVVEGVEINV